MKRRVAKVDIHTSDDGGKYDPTCPHLHPIKEWSMKSIKMRLKYLRKEIQAERISMGEVLELESLAKYIDPSDVLLLEWAGVKEKTRRKV